MANVPFVFKDAKQGTYSRVTGGIRKAFLHLGSGGLSSLVKNVHNLPLSAA
jgi:hypothetical protein